MRARRLGMKSHLLRKATLWIAPLGLLGGTIAYAQNPYRDRYYGYGNGYGYYDDDRDVRHHQRDEKHSLRQHQDEERYYYGDSWALREHQREERRDLKRHQRNERYQYWNGWDANGYNDRGRYYD